MSYVEKSYDVLNSVINDGAYVNIAINSIQDDSDKATVTRIVYGVLEKFYELNYAINSLVQKPPKGATKIALLQGAYCLRYMKIPNYAVVNESVNLVGKVVGKSEKNFVNAVLNRIAKGEYNLPIEKSQDAQEVKYNAPIWLIKLIKKDYPKAYGRILASTTREEEHIRLNVNLSQEEFEKKVGFVEKTKTGYFVKNTDAIKSLYLRGALTYQALSSSYAVKALGDVKGKMMLDVCAAPGGKSVYAAELGAKVTSCDIHPHRVELIKKYAKRMGVTLNAIVADATIKKKTFVNAFDVVLADVPCSGLGVLAKRRDIIFNREEKDIDELVKLQEKILENASSYVKKDGVLVYSTCTVLKKENPDVIARFLQKHSEFKKEKIELGFENDGEIQFLPDGKGLDGFYIVRLRKC